MLCLGVCCADTARVPSLDAKHVSEYPPRGASCPWLAPRARAVDNPQSAGTAPESPRHCPNKWDDFSRKSMRPRRCSCGARRRSITTSSTCRPRAPPCARIAPRAPTIAPLPCQRVALKRPDPNYWTRISLWTDFTPVTSRAIDTALSASCLLLAVPLR